jgi:hypothetical protein
MGTAVLTVGIGLWVWGVARGWASERGAAGVFAVVLAGLVLLGLTGG